MKKVLMIIISLALAQGLMDSCFMDVKGETRGEVITKGGKDRKITVERGDNYDPVPSQVIRLMGPSSKRVSLPPPCCVIALINNKIILKDFYGKEQTIEVEEMKNLKVGDKVVVKDGLMRIGISSR